MLERRIDLQGKSVAMCIKRNPAYRFISKPLVSLRVANPRPKTRVRSPGSLCMRELDFWLDARLAEWERWVGAVVGW